jgi:hypothetical protein
MSEIATFFRHRDDDPGETFHFDLPEKATPYQISVYCRKKMPGKLFKIEEAPETWDAAREKLVRAVQGRGGGIIVTIAGDGPSRTLSVTTADSKNASSASRFVLLSPVAGATFENTGKTYKVSAASHVIVPVDGDAEQRLERFIEQLPWFSRDFETLVLNAIRKPSLDVRLNRVEKQLFGKTDEESRRDTTTGRVARFMTASMQWMLSLEFVLLLVALAILALAAYWFYGPRASKASSSSNTTTTAGTSNGDAGASDTVDASDTVPHDATLFTSTKELLKALNQKGDNKYIKPLYEAHFKEFDHVLLTSQDVDGWLSAQTSGQDRALSRPLLWGIFKLQLLKSNEKPKDAAFLQKGENTPVTRNVFLELKPNLQKDPVSQRLLAAVVCRMGYASDDTPTLPKSGSSDAIPIMSTQCRDLTDQDIINGMAPLTEFVKNLK